MPVEIALPDASGYQCSASQLYTGLVFELVDCNVTEIIVLVGGAIRPPVPTSTWSAAGVPLH